MRAISLLSGLILAILLVIAFGNALDHSLNETFDKRCQEINNQYDEVIITCAK